MPVNSFTVGGGSKSLLTSDHRKLAQMIENTFLLPPLFSFHLLFASALLAQGPQTVSVPLSHCSVGLWEGLRE